MKKDYHCQKNIFHRQNSPKMDYEINKMGVKKNGNKYRVKMKKYFISPMTLTSLYYT